MFDLPGQDPPDSFDALARGLADSVRRRIELPAGAAPVTVEGDAWPAGRLLRVETTGGVVRVDPTLGDVPEHLRPPTLARDRQAGPTFERLAVESKPLRVMVEGGGELPLTVAVTGQNVAFDFGRDPRGNLVMAPSSGEATAELSVGRSDLLRVVNAVARSEAGKRGVTLDRLDADVTAPGPRTLVVRGVVSGSKKVAFFNAGFTVEYAAEMVAEPDANGELIGRVADVRLRGDGAVMNVVLALAKPSVDKVKGTPLPLRDILATAGVQGLRVRDVRVTAGDTLSLRAEFGED